ncbi:DUF4123 domain-containing protein [Aquitalea aquatica]|uniref:DUF4123 domain-containing protein n=1 Tax=Aquitalea aquatica TaxID=3044273 RepID=A0A838Y191_9NEIS|nr:DUF4123 domain-containing protein [Aquitalea magnusonii]MBA4707032.1 DUF4123 domain-containing protein [Aquitalea magnusonii]
MKQLLISPRPTTHDWLTMLCQQALDADLEWLDFIVDQSGINHGWQRHLPVMHPPRALLLDTPHADAADEGPVLIRLALHTPALLEKWQRRLDKWQGQPRLLALLSTCDFEALATHLTACLQVKWDQGRQQGVLRFYDPRLFAPVCACLLPMQQHFLLGCAQQWHWLDRDGHARSLQLPHADTAPAQPPDENLNLLPEQIHTLSLWHAAETWRQNHLLLPAMYGLDSEEELMKRLVAAQYAADQAKLWSEPERMPLVESYLRREAP